jgi:hypothetical protein
MRKVTIAAILMEYKAIIAAALVALGLMLSGGIYKPIASSCRGYGAVNVWTGTIEFIMRSCP